MYVFEDDQAGYPAIFIGIGDWTIYMFFSFNSSIK